MLSPGHGLASHPYLPTAKGEEHVPKIKGTNQSDTLSGTSRDDRILARGGDDFILASGGDDTIVGHDGFDVVSYDGFAQSINVNFRTGLVEIDGKQDRISGIEMVIGTAGNDRFVGANSGESWFQGGRGNDIMIGGRGFDWADYYGAYAGVRVDLRAGTSSGYDGRDTLVRIDNIRGSRHDDILSGDDNGNRIRGMRGDDVIDGRGGFDVADYRNASGGVVVDLQRGIATGADGRDTLRNIEGMRGTYYDDRLIGNGRDNFFETFAGNDRITGGGGSDRFLFANGSGRDTITDFTASGPDRDIIELDISAISNYRDLVRNHMVQVGNDVEIRGSGGEVIVLQGVNAGGLTSANFDI